MDILQTDETTITNDSGNYSLTVLVIPARSYGHLSGDGFSLEEVGGYLFGEHVDPLNDSHHIPMERFSDVVKESPIYVNTDESLLFANYALNARIIPFEQSPLGAESLAGIAASSVKAGTITLGATVGFMVGGHSPFLLITVPMGIVLCGASVGFAKWLEENRKAIWDKPLLDTRKKPPFRKVKGTLSPPRPTRKITFDDDESKPSPESSQE